jgi:hypothetical protein
MSEATTTLSSSSTVVDHLASAASNEIFGKDHSLYCVIAFGALGMFFSLMAVALSPTGWPRSNNPQRLVAFEKEQSAPLESRPLDLESRSRVPADVVGSEIWLISYSHVC